MGSRMTEPQPDLSTLPKRMRYAADVMDEAKTRLDAERGNRDDFFGSEWHSYALRRRAQIWEDAGPVDELTRKLAELGSPAATGGYAQVARKLIESGWHK